MYKRQLEDLESLIALGGGTSGAGDFVINKDAKVNQAILSGNFGKSGSVIQGAKQATVRIIDVNGNDVIDPIDMGAGLENGKLLQNFAAILPEAGTYYVYVTSDIDPEGAFVSQTANYTSIAYTIKENQLLSKPVSACKAYGVQYEFVSATENMTLPEDMPELPETISGQKLSMDAFLNGATCDKTYEDIAVEGGHWRFDGWGHTSVLTERGNLVNTAKVVGSWTFVADEPEPVDPDPVDPVDPVDPCLLYTSTLPTICSV